MKDVLRNKKPENRCAARVFGVFISGDPSGTRTRDTLIKRRLALMVADVKSAYLQGFSRE